MSAGLGTAAPHLHGRPPREVRPRGTWRQRGPSPWNPIPLALWTPATPPPLALRPLRAPGWGVLGVFTRWQRLAIPFPSSRGCVNQTVRGHARVAQMDALGEKPQEGSWRSSCPRSETAPSPTQTGMRARPQVALPSVRGRGSHLGLQETPASLGPSRAHPGWGERQGASVATMLESCPWEEQVPDTSPSRVPAWQPPGRRAVALGGGGSSQAPTPNPLLARPPEPVGLCLYLVTLGGFASSTQAFGIRDGKFHLSGRHGNKQSH